MQTNYEDLFAGELRNELKAQNEDLNTNDMKIAKPIHPETIKTVKNPIKVHVEIVAEDIKPAIKDNSVTDNRATETPVVEEEITEAPVVEEEVTETPVVEEDKPVTKRGRKKKSE